MGCDHPVWGLSKRHPVYVRLITCRSFKFASEPCRFEGYIDQLQVCVRLPSPFSREMNFAKVDVGFTDDPDCRYSYICAVSIGRLNL